MAFSCPCILCIAAVKIVGMQESKVICCAQHLLVDKASCGAYCLVQQRSITHQRGPESLDSKADLRLAASEPLFPHNAWSVPVRKNLRMHVTPLPSSHMHILLRPDMATAAMTLAGGGHGLNVLLVTPRHCLSRLGMELRTERFYIFQRCPRVPPSQMGFVHMGIVISACTLL